MADKPEETTKPNVPEDKTTKPNEVEEKNKKSKSVWGVCISREPCQHNGAIVRKGARVEFPNGIPVAKKHLFRAE